MQDLKFNFLFAMIEKKIKIFIQIAIWIDWMNKKI